MSNSRRLNVSSGYETSDWGRFLSCWIDRYTGPINDKTGTIVFGHTTRAATPPDLKKVEENFGFALPRSLRDFLTVYNPDVEWLENRIAERNSFMLPAGRLELLSSFEPETYSIWTEEEDVAEDGEYFIYGKGQDNAVFRSFQYPRLIMLGKTAENDYVMLNPFVSTEDGEMEVVLHSSFSIFRTLSFATMMRSLYCYECEKVTSYPPYSEGFLNLGCGKLIVSKL